MRVLTALIVTLTLFSTILCFANKYNNNNKGEISHEHQRHRSKGELNEFLDRKKPWDFGLNNDQELETVYQLYVEYQKNNNHPNEQTTSQVKYDNKKYDKSNRDLPPINDGALMARYVVNQADWTSVATISTRKDIQSFPTVNVISFSDGPLGNGTGIPYMYLTPLDYTAQDVAKDYRVSLLMTLAQGQYCRSMSWDPMDPRCARVILTGNVEKVKNGSVEHETAKRVVFGRHPKLAGMPADHHFFFAKLKIKNIAVLDTFGGPKYVSVRDYLHPSKPNITQEFNRRFPSSLKYQLDSQDSSFDANVLSNNFNPIVNRV